MGSLMAGWDSPRSKSGKGGFERSKSLTQEEIDNFWKIKRKSEEEHLKAVLEAGSSISKDDTLITQTGGSGKQKMIAFTPPPRLEISRSFPGRDSGDTEFVKDVDTMKRMETWWTRSNWAFLNEPPLTEMEGPAYKYAAQHDVAALVGQKQDFSADGVATTF